MFIQSYRTEPGGGGGNPWLPDPELLFDHTQYIHVAEVMLQIKTQFTYLSYRHGTENVEENKGAVSEICTHQIPVR